MKIGICDDEKEIRDCLAQRIRLLEPPVEVTELSLYASGEELLQEEALPDILFLDIQMSGMNGMDVARRLRAKNRRMILIFVTGLEEYVFQAFDVGAFHYLVKPFLEEKFQAVLRAAMEQYEEQKNTGMGVGDIRDKKEEERCLVVKRGGTRYRICLSELIYAEVFNRKIVLHMEEGDIEYYGRMAELERQAGEDFYRPHRAYLVHLKYVLQYDAANIYMERGKAILAKQKYADFVKKYMDYIRRKGR